MPTISHSQIETWQTCPLRWKLQHDRVPETPQPALLLGRAVHTAIEQENRARLEGRAPPTLEALADLGRAALLAELERDDPAGLLRRQMPALALQVEALLAAYQRQIAGRFPPLRVEQPFRLPLPDWPGWEFSGRIDALVTDDSGARQIVDYKTSKRRWPLGEEQHKLQADAYLWAAEQQPEWGDVQGVIFIPLSAAPAGTDYAAWAEARPTYRTSEQLVSYTQLLTQILDEMAESAAAGAYVARPDWYCAWCSVAAACPVQAGKRRRHADEVAPL